MLESERNWVIATNSVFVKPKSLQPYDVNLWYFKLTLFDLRSFIVWNIKGLRHWVATILKLENQSLWQKLESSDCCFCFRIFRELGKYWNVHWVLSLYDSTTEEFKILSSYFRTTGGHWSFNKMHR